MRLLVLVVLSVCGLPLLALVVYFDCICCDLCGRVYVAIGLIECLD